MKKIKVLIVDDALVVRHILKDTLSSDPDIEVLGVAANGKIGIAKVLQLNPDVVTLDVEMPEMDGVETVRALRKTHPRMPIIMFSTLTDHGAAATLDALNAGATDYVTKPANVGSVVAAIDRVRHELIPKIKACVAGKPSPAAGAGSAARPVPISRPRPGVMFPRVDVIAIGSSTGGPNALAEVLPLLPAHFPVPVLITQHMPPIFTKHLADRLAMKRNGPVTEAQSGDRLEPGKAYIAPGDYHLGLERRKDGVYVKLNRQPPENSCRPAVDVMLRSVAEVYGARSLTVILTGMGSDGLVGCTPLHKAGARVIVQDEQSSIVWGMPGSVARAGLAHQVLPLNQIAQAIQRITSEFRACPTHGSAGGSAVLDTRGISSSAA